jgi:hypothetical protein
MKYIFPESILHSVFSEFEIVSAGFIQIVDNDFICFGESPSLDIKSRKKDASIIRKYLEV